MSSNHSRVTRNHVKQQAPCLDYITPVNVTGPFVALTLKLTVMARSADLAKAFDMV